MTVSAACSQGRFRRCYSNGGPPPKERQGRPGLCDRSQREPLVLAASAAPLLDFVVQFIWYLSLELANRFYFAADIRSSKNNRTRSRTLRIASDSRPQIRPRHQLGHGVVNVTSLVSASNHPKTTVKYNLMSPHRATPSQTQDFKV